MRRVKLVPASVLAVLLSAVLALAAGCGNKGGLAGEDLPKRELPENATPQKILLEAVKATEEVKSLEFRMDYTILIPPSGNELRSATLHMQGDGVFDVRTGNSRATVTWLEWNNFQTEYVIYEGKHYFKVYNNWYEMPAGMTVGPNISEMTRNTSEYLNNFQTINRMEDEEVNERDCFHISMVPNFENILEQSEVKDFIKQSVLAESGQDLSEEKLEEKIEQFKQDLQKTGVSYEYWIDKETLTMRRTYYKIEAKAPSADSKEARTFQIIMEMAFPKYNVDVQVNRPEVAMQWKGNQ